MFILGASDEVLGFEFLQNADAGSGNTVFDIDYILYNRGQCLTLSKWLTNFILLVSFDTP